MKQLEKDIRNETSKFNLIWGLIMNNRLEIAREFAKTINSDKIVKIILFGSVAHDEDAESFYIDILIVSDYRDEIWDDIGAVIWDIVFEKKELISAHFMPVNRFYSKQHYSFLSNVLEDGVNLI